MLGRRRRIQIQIQGSLLLEKGVKSAANTDAWKKEANTDTDSRISS